MAERRIKGKDLAQALGVSPVEISRLRSQDFIPPIGGRDLERLAQAITSLSPNGIKPCKISDFIRE